MNNFKLFNLKREWFFLLAIFISFNTMFSNYLYEFDSGDVKGGELLRSILKSSSIILLIFSKPTPSKLLIKKNILFIFIFLFFLISYLFYIPFSIWNELQFFNLYIVLFILFGVGYQKKYIPKLNILLIYMFLFLWLPIDLIAISTGNNLWQNKAFIGGLGNPSSYGIILIYLILINKNIFSPFKESILNFVLIISVLFTQAMMPILILLLFSFSIFKKRFLFIIFTFLIIIGLFYLNLFLDTVGFNDLHFLNKIISLYQSGLLADTASVSYRLEYWLDINRLFDNPLKFLFGHVNRASYNAGDGQYVAYLTSFGVPIFFIFIFSFFRILSNFKNQNFINGKGYKLFFIAFTLILLTNRYLDYWPNAIIIFLIINHINLEKHEYWNNQSFSI